MSRWLVIRETERSRWGGDLRRRYIFEALLERTAGTSLELRGPLRRALLDLRGPRWAIWRRTRVAAAELLLPRQLENVQELGVAVAVDIHDEPVLQAEALGVPLEPPVAAELRARIADNTAAFRWLVAPSRPFAELAGLDLDRVVVAGNGTDTALIRHEAWPKTPAVGFISGAAPNRGIEELIAAVRLVRDEVPGTRLLLWLAATGDASGLYLEALRAAVADDPWIEIGSAPYDRLSSELGRATLLVIPTPAHPYWDSVAPIKLYDGMAVGRPTVTTPRTEIVREIEEVEAGLVADGESPGELAVPMIRLLNDQELARRLGANARQAAETRFDWRLISGRLADTILAAAE
jgi:glycosyltransferase involved in cell wall biosynthesis